MNKFFTSSILTFFFLFLFSSSVHAIAPSNIDLKNIIGHQAVIMGYGARYETSLPSFTDKTQYTGLSYYGPAVAVIEYTDRVTAVWSETFRDEYIEYRHSPDHDELIFKGGNNWQIQEFSNWVEFARHWRQRYEIITGVKPLWQKDPAWIRNIHAMFSASNHFYYNNWAKYQELASKAPPQEVLYFLWNGSQIVLFGDHRLMVMASGQKPAPNQVAYIKSLGYKIFLYHPFNLLPPDSFIPTRLQYLIDKNWLPNGYVYTPDFPAGFNPDDYTAPYYSGEKNRIVHPGSIAGKNYIVHNYNNYIRYHNVDGAYMDIMGAPHSFSFPADRQIMDGNTYIQGSINVLKEVDYPVMIETSSNWIIPYTFYSWEGVIKYANQLSYLQNLNPYFEINHPLKAALLGSYMWSRESNEDNSNIVTATLLAGLPELSLIGDYHISDERALLSQQRVKLYTDYDLWHDIPNWWDPQALAYFRSNTGNWFKFIPINNTYAYVEELPNGQQKVHLTLDGSSPTLPPISPQPSTFPTSKPGDANNDGQVDGVDYVVWLTHYNQPVTGPAFGDFNNSGKVDGTDYVIWLNNYMK